MRKIRDAQMEVTKALPAANANNLSDAIDLTQGGDVPENVEIEIVAPAVPSLADTKTATYTIHESDDNSSYAAAPWCPTITQTGASGAGAAAATLRVRPPQGAKRYIKLRQAVVADGGDNTAKSGTMRLLF